MIATARLDLHPLPLPVIEALLAGDVAGAGAQVPYAVTAASFPDDAYVLGLRRDQLRADPSELPWLYRAAVLRETGEVVARAGFHAPPDPHGTVEIGYRVQPARQRQGLATEIVDGLLRWASCAGALRCLASTGPHNVASQAVLARFGFRQTGEQWDDVDGRELVFTLQPLPGLR